MRKGHRAWPRRAASLVVVGHLALAPVAADEVPDLSYLLADGHGLVLEEAGGSLPRMAPGLVQLMVVLLALEQVQFGMFPIDGPVVASEPAATIDGGVLRLDRRRMYRLEELLRASVVAGARDATVAVADLICGGADGCAELMHRRAELLGMASTRLSVPGGEAAAEPDSTTVRDAALLAQALLDHPETLRWSSQRGFLFDGGPVVLTNTNSLVGAIAEVDGLQVSRLGEHCSVIATAERSGARMLAIVMGSAPVDHCSRLALQLLDRGFATYENVALVRAGESLKYSIEVERGSVEHITPVATASYSFSQKRGSGASPALVLRYQLPARIEAPVERDAIVGELVVERDGQVVAVIPARSPLRVVRRGLF